MLHDVGAVLPTRGEDTGATLVELETTATTVRGDPALRVERQVLDLRREGRVTVTRDGDCFRYEAERDSDRVCLTDTYFGRGRGSSDVPGLDPILRRLDTAVAEVAIVTVEVDGKHYLSPSRTLVGAYAGLLGALEPGDVATLACLAQRRPSDC